MFSVATILIIFAAAAGSGTMVAIIAWFLNRLKSLESGGSSGHELRRLSSELDDLRADLLATHSEVKDLTERLDFTERLLSTGRDEKERESS